MIYLVECPVCYGFTNQHSLICKRCFGLGVVQEGKVEAEDYMRKDEKKKAIDRPKVASDGLSTDYYKIPDHAVELRHLISYKAMSKSRGDIFKACYRLGEKEGVDAAYDLNKMKFFIQDLIEMNERGEHL